MGPPVTMRSAGCFACARASDVAESVAATSSASVVRNLVMICGCGLRELRGFRDAGMDEAHRHRAFPDGRCAALHGATPNIACGEHSGKARLEKKWSATHRAPPFRVGGFRRKRRASEHETVLVERHAAAQPVRVRFGADEEKERARVHLL